MKLHRYQTKVIWRGNEGEGTLAYDRYNRNHVISAPNKLGSILGSSDPSFRGDAQRYNPEEMLLASISSCHMLWYLHLCAVNGVVVVDYTDEAEGVMEEDANGSGKFTKATLRPVVKVADKSMCQRAEQLHHEANELCFIANSCNLKVEHEPTILVGE